MLCRELKEFEKLIPKDKCIMCLDLGRKIIGIAFSDRTNLIATPHSVYYRRNTRKDIGFLNKLFIESEASSMVIGLPLELDGEENIWCVKVQDFANKIIKIHGIIIYLQDERCSTSAAIEILKVADLSYQKSKMLDDKIAASIILQQTLDAINFI